MEENIVRTDEVEELDTVNEVEEPSEASGAGGVVAGIVGGFLAFAVISATKELVAFAGKKWKARKRQRETDDTIVDVEIIESEAEQPDSNEETQSK